MDYDNNNNQDHSIDEQYLMSIMAGSPKKEVPVKMQTPKKRKLQQKIS